MTFSEKLNDINPESITSEEIRKIVVSAEPERLKVDRLKAMHQVLSAHLAETGQQASASALIKELDTSLDMLLTVDLLDPGYDSEAQN